MNSNLVAFHQAPNTEGQVAETAQNWTTTSWNLLLKLKLIGPRMNNTRDLPPMARRNEKLEALQAAAADELPMEI